MIWLRRIGIVSACLIAIAVAVWVFRASILDRVAEAYFRAQGIASSVAVSRFDWGGLAAQIALGDAEAPAFSADSAEVTLAPGTLQISAVRLVHPVFRLRADANGVVVPSLQAWIESLAKNAVPGAQSRFVSADLAIRLDVAQAIVTTTGGIVTLDFDARIAGGKVESFHASVRPMVLSLNGNRARIAGARIAAQATPSGYAVTAQVSGAFDRTGLRAAGIKADLSLGGLDWSSAQAGISVLVPQAHLKISAEELGLGGETLSGADADITLQQLRAGRADGGLNGEASIAVVAHGGMDPADMRRIVGQLPLVGADRKMVAALAAAVRGMTLTFAAHLTSADANTTAQLTAPAILKAASGAMLAVRALRLSGSAKAVSGMLDASLGGGGLPRLVLRSRNFTWKGDDGGTLDADAALDAHFDYAMLSRADFSAAGRVFLRDGRFGFALTHCAQTALAAFRTDQGVAARNIRGGICAYGSMPLLLASPQGWRLSAHAEGFSLLLPLESARLTDAAGTLDFGGSGSGPPQGHIQFAAMRFTDEVAPVRFKPMTASGEVALAGGLWRGQMTVRDGVRHAELGKVDFTHAMASGAGKAVIDAPALLFATGGLQPVDLSPLLVSLVNANGKVRFAGTLAWTHDGVTSNGLLTVDSLDFKTPLGVAHSVHSTIALASLLPPVTEDGQHLDISRVDAVLPITGLEMTFAAGPGSIHIEATRTDIASGSASLAPITIELANTASSTGVVRLAKLDLAQIVAASNIGDQVKITGLVSGTVPFSFGPAGFRIADGHVELAGPGRLEIDRTLWTKGAAVSSMQDLAYQALEHLAVDSLSANINSVAGGRLQIVFHIKGENDPPKPEEARIGLFDLIEGKALDKPIPLPKGTPIDLTLDTSLNFDELLQSYRDAWSNSLSQ